MNDDSSDKTPPRAWAERVLLALIVFLSLALTVTLLWSAVGRPDSADYKIALRHAENLAAVHARLVEEQVRRILETARSETKPLLEGPLLAAPLLGKPLGSAGIVGLVVIDSAGRVTAAPHSPELIGLPWADEKRIKALGDGQTGPVRVGAPFFAPWLRQEVWPLGLSPLPASGTGERPMLLLFLDGPRIRNALESALLPGTGLGLQLMSKDGTELAATRDAGPLQDTLAQAVRAARTSSSGTTLTSPLSPGEQTQTVLAVRYSESLPVVIVVSARIIPFAERVPPGTEITWSRPGIALLLGLVLVLAGVPLIALAVSRRRLRQEMAELSAEKTSLTLRVARLSRLESATQASYWEQDIVGQTRYWSPPCLRLLGLEPGPEDTARDSPGLAHLVHPDDQTRLRQWRQSLLASDSAQEVEVRMVLPDGAMHHVTIRGLRDRNPFGAPVRLYGTLTDETERAEARNRLRESEEKYRILFDQAHDALLLTDRTSDSVLDANIAAGTLLGCRREEMIGRPLGVFTGDYDLSRPDMEPGSGPELVRASRPGQPLQISRRFTLGQDGVSRVLELAQGLIWLHGRDVLVSAVRDVTERAEAELRLIATTARLTEAERMANIGHWEWRIIRNEMVWSDGLWRILGLDEGTLVPGMEPFLRLVHPDDRDRVQNSWTQAQTGFHVTEFEFRLIRPDGARRHLRATTRPFRDASDRFGGVFGTVLDITELRVAEHALAENHVQVMAMINASEEDMIGLVDPQGTFRILNNRGARHFRCAPRLLADATRAESLEEPASGPQSPDQTIPFHALFDEVLVTGQPIRQEVIADDVVFDTHVSPAAGPDGRTLGLAMFARDITERKRTERTLRRLKGEAERADAEKAKFLAAASHYLTLIDLLVKASTDEDRAHQVDQIRKSVLPHAPLFNALLDFSRSGS